MKRYSGLHCNDVEVRIKSLTITQSDDWTVTFNYTAEVAQQLKDMIAAYNTGEQSNLRTWFEIWIPNATNGFYVVAQPPQILSMPEFSQNELLTIDVVMAVEEYIGDDVAIEPVG